MTYEIPNTRVVILEDYENAGLYAAMLGVSHEHGQLLDTLIALATVPPECFPEGVGDAAAAVRRVNDALAPLGAEIVAEGAAWRMNDASKAALETRVAAWI